MRIKVARKAVKKTQEGLAELMGISLSYIGQMERGATKISLETLAQIAAHTKTDLPTLVGGVSVKEEDYLFDEMDARLLGLHPKERQMMCDFVDMLIKNR
jgi:transcriptional regulator with XRE-family HTH domain